MKQVANLIPFLPPSTDQTKQATFATPKGFEQIFHQSMTTPKDKTEDAQPVEHVMQKMGASVRVNHPQGKPSSKTLDKTDHQDQRTKTTEEDQAVTQGQADKTPAADPQQNVKTAVATQEKQQQDAVTADGKETKGQGKAQPADAKAQKVAPAQELNLQLVNLEQAVKGQVVGQGADLQLETKGLAKEVMKLLSNHQLSKEELAQVHDLLKKITQGTELAKILLALQALAGQALPEKAGQIMQGKAEQIPAGEPTKGEQSQPVKLGDLLKLVQQVAQEAQEALPQQQGNMQSQPLVSQLQTFLQRLVSASKESLPTEKLWSPKNLELLNNLVMQAGKAINAVANQLTSQLQQLQAKLGSQAPLMQALTQVVQDTQQLAHILSDQGALQTQTGAALVKLQALVQGLTQKTSALEQATQVGVSGQLPKLEVVTSPMASSTAKQFATTDGPVNQAANLSDAANQSQQSGVRKDQTHAQSDSPNSGDHVESAKATTEKPQLQDVNLLVHQTIKPEQVLAEGVKPNLINPTLKTAEPVLTPQVRDSVFQQIVQKAQLVVAGKNSDMIVQLKPEHLGKVSLQISVENGLVTAKFETQSHQVKEVIEANINNLKQNLTNQGLKLNQVSVHIGGEAGQPHWQRRQLPFAKRNNNKRGEQSYEEADYLEAAPIATVEYGRGLNQAGTVDYVV